MARVPARLACAMIACLAAGVARAQPYAGPPDADAAAPAGPAGGASPFGGGGHHGHRGRHDTAQPAADRPAPLKVTPDPPQRLERGALLCDTEAELQQHQAAVAARLSGGSAPEPGGCRILPEMAAVGVVARHGLASTEVRLSGPDTPQGWTDSMVHDAPDKPR